MGAERFSHLMLIAAAAKNHTTALAGAGNAPLLPPAAASSPEGQICSMFSFLMLRLL